MEVISAESLVLIEVPDDINIGGCVLEDGWCQLTAQDPTYPWDVPLYKSPQFDVGCVEFDPCTVTGTQRPSSSDGGVKKFNIKVNVWFCPAKTNCGIHNVHTDPEMLEVFTNSGFLSLSTPPSPLPPPTPFLLLGVADFEYSLIECNLILLKMTRITYWSLFKAFQVSVPIAGIADVDSSENIKN